MTLTEGSLCTGYNGLGLAAESVFGAHLEWCSEIEPAPARLLAGRYPGAPNLGDLKTVDWADVPPVDILTAGYPCQPFSTAGRRRGVDDDRHLWPYIADAVRVLRPRLVVLENVAGHLRLGFDVVLADLAALGFDAEWCTVRASDVGACHRRERLFVVAADTNLVGRPWRGDTGSGEGLGVPWRESPRADQTERREARRDASDGSGAQTAADPDRLRREGPVSEPLGHDVRGDPRSAPDASSRGRGTGTGLRSQREGGLGGPEGVGRGRPGDEDRAAHADAVRWGIYEPAVRRHAAVVGRPAPSPVTSAGQLSPRFVEWMQMLPEGWVTDVEPHRGTALKMLGNGVVPPQAAHAVAGLAARLAG